MKVGEQAVYGTCIKHQQRIDVFGEPGPGNQAHREAADQHGLQTKVVKNLS
ncbi:MAG TPA: hypothetical protein VGS41_07775 [Chthonomonadales bacterium]|nr:hypothetical protein [Chthonomonadales bacterium]